MVFHYHDKEAVLEVRRLRKDHANFISVCLSSDVYSFNEYVNLLDVTDLFMVPTALHRDILQSGVNRPVYVLPECYDSLTSQTDEVSNIQPSLRAFWFGYAESFQKGMWSLAPVIKSALAGGRLTAFDVVTRSDSLRASFGFNVVNFDQSRFSALARTYGYSILSHFPLDLHVNSYIKSPNKLITSFLLGVTPIVSSTPSYAEVMHQFGLQRLLFESPVALARILDYLNPQYDSDQVAGSGIIEHILNNLNEEAVARSFVQNLHGYLARDDFARDLDRMSLDWCAPKEEEVEFSSLMRKIVPSGIRALRRQISPLRVKR